MQDPFPIPSCIFPGDDGHGNHLSDADPASIAAAAKPGRSVVASAYRAKIAGRCRLITVTWCRDLLGRGFSIAVEGPDGGCAAADPAAAGCKVELRPWQFWRRRGSKRLPSGLGGPPVDVFWDLRSAKFSGEPEPRSGYYIAVAAGEEGEVVLLLGDLGKEAYRKSGCRPAPIEAALVSKKEHVFGRKTFSTRSKFHAQGRVHQITIECGGGGGGGSFDSEMAISIDGEEAVAVKHLQWKFRGNHSITVSAARVEVYWDVHNWLFSPGMRHALFIFKSSPTAPCSTTSSSSSAPTLSSLLSSSSSASTTTEKIANYGGGAEGSAAAGYCLFLYAWKLE